MGRDPVPVRRRRFAANAIGANGPRPSRRVQRGTILGISFDGLAISGVVNEFLHLAYVFHRSGYRVLLDLGYDITLSASLDNEPVIPTWVELVRAAGRKLPARYDKTLIEDATTAVTAGTPVAEAGYAGLCHELAAQLVSTMMRERVEILIIENGTLPDNPIFTEAVYIAIREYALRRRLGRFVLWRDWDLMWSTEPQRYGKYPFRGVHKPEANKYIHYAVASDWMRQRIQAWAPGVEYHVIPSRFFASTLPLKRAASLRAAHSIPGDAYLVARCSRVIPQKSIERDLRLFDFVQQRLNAVGDVRKVFLFISGPTAEDIEEFARLYALQQTLSISDQVVWGNGLLPFNPLLLSSQGEPARFSIQDLLAESDLSSFLTSYDYEGFGNPPGEAMAMGVPFIVTTYELYPDVYGRRGAIAPLLPINRSSTPSDAIPEEFVDRVVQLLTDDAYRSRLVEHNLAVCHRFFSLDALERQLHEIFDDR